MSAFNHREGHDSGEALQRAERRIRELEAELRNRPNVAPEVAQFAQVLESRTSFIAVFPDAELALRVFSEAVEAYRNRGQVGSDGSLASWRAGQLK
jgi:hypothetical protein